MSEPTKLSQATEPSKSGERWRAVEQWRTGVIESTRAPIPALIVAAAVAVGFLFAGGELWGLRNQLQTPDYLLALPALLCLAPLGFVGVEVRRRWKYGRIQLVLDDVPVAPGGHIDGRLRAGHRPARAEIMRVSLVCLRVSVLSRERALQKGVTRKTVLARYEHEIGLDPASVRDLAAVPISVPVPLDALETTARRPGDSGVAWRLEVRVPGEGLDLLAAFELPVFR